MIGTDARRQSAPPGLALNAGELDVFETEPLPPDHVLWRMPGMIITPHMAGYGPHVNERRYEILHDNCERFLAGTPLRNLVDKRQWF